MSSAAWGTSWRAFVELNGRRVAGAGCIQYLRREATVPSGLEGLQTNPLEIGRRLHPDFWQHGLTSEAAVRMAAVAFESLSAPELMAVRHADNAPSVRVMDRLGIQYRGIEHWYGANLATHVLRREKWLHPELKSGEA